MAAWMRHVKREINIGTVRLPDAMLLIEHPVNSGPSNSSKSPRCRRRIKSLQRRTIDYSYMAGYEYIRLEFDFGDLVELNRLASVGWHVVSVIPTEHSKFTYWALLERQVR